MQGKWRVTCGQNGVREKRHLFGLKRETLGIEPLPRGDGACRMIGRTARWRRAAAVQARSSGAGAQ